MHPTVNLILSPKTRQWTVLRLRTKQCKVNKGKSRLNRGKPAINSCKRAAIRKYAHRVIVHLEYSRCTSVSST